ncbi:MAG: serine hydrolase domain-containing protein [bacterium]
MNRLAPLLCVALATGSALSAQQSDSIAHIDNIFAKYDRNTPGCAVALGKEGQTLYTHGYGSANLEYGVPLTDSTVMESGSVAKQFTAAAVVLLQNDGKLSLDDDIRKYLPEVPNFGQTITIRHLLTHTSGLRDQWGLLEIQGRGPGTQVHSPMTTLDLVAHQTSLNFPPGSRYLYSNTGYALVSIIVERVSGMSFSAFSRDRLFVPLGMTHTQWRDDFTRVVPNRATAYAADSGKYFMNMPFTNMIGNGGLLTTMADLLKWNENLDHPIVGGPSFTTTMQTRMVLTSGRMISYALGVSVGDYDGVREVSHNGATAGYRTFLARYPDQHVSVAVWCSNAGANPDALAHKVADLVLVKPARAATAVSPMVRMTAADLSHWAGGYVDSVTGQFIALSSEDSVLKGSGTTLIPTGANTFRAATGTVVFSQSGERKQFTLARFSGDTSVFQSVKAASSSVTISDYVGTYRSDELDYSLSIVVRSGKLLLQRRGIDDIELKATYADAFEADGLGAVRFSRDATARVNRLAFFAGRVLDVRFARVR